jgi:hypothetical protein
LKKTKPFLKSKRPSVVWMKSQREWFVCLCVITSCVLIGDYPINDDNYDDK